MRIGFDAKRLFNNFTGLGNYSRTLVKNLVQYFPEYLPLYLFTPGMAENAGTQFFQKNDRFKVIRPKGLPLSYWRSFGMHKDINAHDIDLFHGLSHELPVGIGRTKAKSVVTIHDLAFKRYPRQYAFADRIIYDFKFASACRRADRIVAISEHTRQDIIEFYHVEPHKIEVVYQTCDDHFKSHSSEEDLYKISTKYKLPQDFLLYVGSINERKNLLGLTKAYTGLAKSLRPPLVVVGGGSKYKKKVEEYIHSAGLTTSIWFLKPDYQELPLFYKLALAFVYPSLYEGFGIPVLEALFSGTPVITSNVSSLPEAAGPMSLLVDPTNQEQLLEALSKVIQDGGLRQKMSLEGIQYAQRFQAEPLTRRLMDVYQMVLDFG